MKKATYNIVKRLIVICLAAAMLLSFAACGDEAARPIGKYSAKIKASSQDSGTVAENDRFTMKWDSERFCVLVTDKQSGKTWSNIPYDYYANPNADYSAGVLLNSPLNVHYISQPNNRLNTYYGSYIESEGRISAKAVEDGIRLIYLFDKIGIAVPVIYKLKSDHFTVTVDTNGILEDEYPVYRIDIAPFMVSTPASDSKDSYLVVPSGSGALMYSDERDGKNRSYEEEVYGNDYAETKDYISKDVFAATMPIFGAANGENSILGIIEEGASNCYITATAGDSTVGFSGAYASFAVRGNNTELIGLTYGNVKRVDAYSDGFVNTKCTVGYYPLANEDSSYSGMAKRYRAYLEENNKMTQNVATQPLYLQVIGGVSAQKSFLGVPYYSVEAATTVEQASEIAESVKNNTSLEPVLQLKGFGSSGNSIGKLAGGYTVSGALGSFKEIAQLQTKFPNTYIDFDIIRYTESGNGTSYNADAAKSENKAAAYQFVKYAIAMGNGVDDNGEYRMIKRSSIADGLAKVTKKLKKYSLNGVSLSTVGQMAYSDYRSPNYYGKGGMDTDISAMLSQLDSNLTVMTQNAFSYAAAHSDHVISAPSKSSQYDSLDASIPFYQMVFKGSVSLSGESITLSGNPRDTFLETLSTGSGLLFTVTNHHSNEFIKYQSALAAGVYSSQSETIKNYVNEAKELLEAVAGCSIVSHSFIASGVTETVFDNGVTVAVNRTDTAKDSSIGKVESQSFIYR